MISAVFLMLGSTVLTVTAILNGSLDAPKIFVLFNPVGVMPLLLLARKLGLKIGGSLGIGFSLLGTVLIAAAV